MNKTLKVYTVGGKSLATEIIIRNLHSVTELEQMNINDSDIFFAKPKNKLELFLFNTKSIQIVAAGSTYIRSRCPHAMIASLNTQQADSFEKLFLYKSGVDFLLDETDIPAFVTERIMSCLRRYREHENAECNKDIISFLEGAKCVVYKGKYIRLTPTQFKIFRLIATKEGNTIAREELATLCNFQEHQIRNIDVQLCYIRSKIRETGLEVKAKNGVGYFLDKLRESA